MSQANQPRVPGRRRPMTVNIATQPARGTSSPILRLSEYRETTPTSGGMSALPRAARANMTPPTFRARVPYHFESHAIKIGKMLARPSPARKAPPNKVTGEWPARKMVSPVAASNNPPKATVTSFQWRRMAAAAPRPPSSPAKKHIGASAQALLAEAVARCACVGAQQEVPTSVPTYTKNKVPSNIAAPVPAISSFASPDEAFSSCGGLPKGMRKSPRARTTPRTPTTFRRRLTCDVRIASMARGEEEIAPAPQARFMTLRAEARRVPYDSPTHKFVPGVAKP